jgi:aspartate carbamoyltransferase catalytic subunit
VIKGFIDYEEASKGRKRTVLAGRNGMSFEGRDVVSIRDFDRKDIDQVLATAKLMEPLTKAGSELLKGRIAANLFYEPSTRTRMSFEAAMLRLGGNCVNITEPRTSSIEKGESLYDTLRVVENYSDLIVLRHPLEGSAKLAADVASIPVINAGSGSEEHPTQAILDLYTIWREKGKLDGTKIAILGDLRYGRTAHSLAYALSNYDTDLSFVSPEPLRMRREVLEEVRSRVKVSETTDIRATLPDVDVLYVTRIQKERFPDLEEYQKVRGAYRITPAILREAKTGLIVMHPLPRVDEIALDVDRTAFARYFREVWYGMVVRMALLALILGAV